MDDNIFYDFNLSKTVCENLEDISQLLNTNVISAKADNMEQLSVSWRDEVSGLYAKKYATFIEEVKQLNREINSEAEQIRHISRRMFLIEQEAKRLALEKGTQGS